MYSDNKQIRDVADVAARIMAGLPITEKLHPNQQKLDVHEPEKDELTSDDFKKLRAGKKADVKKEEVESIDEADLLAKRDKPNDFGTRPGLPQGKNLLKVRMKADQGKHTKPNLPEEVELDEKISISYKVPTDNENFGAKPGDTTRFPKSPNITRKMQLHRDVTAKAVKSIRAQGGNPANHPDIKINKEEVELDEGLQQTLRKYVPGYAKAQLNKKMDAQNYASGDSTKKTVDKDVNYNRYKKVANKLNKEEVESIDEVKMADLPSTKVQGRAYGASKPEPHPLDVMKGPTEKQLLGVKSEKKKKFSEMVNLYQNGGMKSFMEALSKEEEEEIIDDLAKEIADETMDIGEQADTAEFTKTLETNKAKASGKVKQPDVAKAAVQAVQQEQTHTKVEFIDYNDVNGVKCSEIELGEDNMNSAEMEKREKIVKGMKKGMAGFKERYGARAKNVMYATATKQAMKS